MERARGLTYHRLSKAGLARRPAGLKWPSEALSVPNSCDPGVFLLARAARQTRELGRKQLALMNLGFDYCAKAYIALGFMLLDRSQVESNSARVKQ